MRRALWEDCPDDQQVREMREILESDTEAVLFAERPGGGLCGFVEVAILPWIVGCDSTPVGYIEGWFVDEDVRRRDVGRALVGYCVPIPSETACLYPFEASGILSKIIHGRTPMSFGRTPAPSGCMPSSGVRRG